MTASSGDSQHWFLYMLGIAAVTVLVMYGLNKYQESRMRQFMDRMEDLHTFNANGTLGCEIDADHLKPLHMPRRGRAHEEEEVERYSEPEPERERYYAPPSAPVLPSAPKALKAAPILSAPPPPPKAKKAAVLPKETEPPGYAPPVQMKTELAPPVLGANRPLEEDKYELNIMEMAGPVKHSLSQTAQMQKEQGRKLNEMEAPEMPQTSFFDNENPADVDAIVYDRQIIARIKPARRGESDHIRGDLHIPRDPNRGMFVVSDTAMSELNQGALNQIADIQVSVQKTDLLYSRGTERDVLSPNIDDGTKGWDLYRQPPKHTYT